MDECILSFTICRYNPTNWTLLLLLIEPRVYLSVSAELGKGAVLPRMKNAQLVNTVLGMEKVRAGERLLMSGECLAYWRIVVQLGAERVVWLTFVFFLLTGICSHRVRRSGVASRRQLTIGPFNSPNTDAQQTAFKLHLPSSGFWTVNDSQIWLRSIET